MKRIALLGLAALLFLAGGVQARAAGGDCLNVKFRTCNDKTGDGFYWVDTQSGKTWRININKMEWTYCGRPDGAKPDAFGTYVPQENKSGEGIFILNTSTGEGWWTNGKSWRRIGLPLDTTTAKPET